MTLMVFGEQQARLPIKLRLEGLELAAQQILLEQLFSEPQGNRHAKRREPAGCEREVRLQQPLEFEKGLVIESDAIEIRQRRSAFRQTVGDRLARIAAVMLLPGETLFLRRRHDPPVLDQCGRTIVIESRNPQNPHIV